MKTEFIITGRQNSGWIRSFVFLPTIVLYKDLKGYELDFGFLVFAFCIKFYN